MLSPKYKKYFVLIGVLVLVCVLAADVLAADMEKLNQELDKQDQMQVKSPSLFLSFLKLIVALGLIIGAAWAVLQLFNRQMNLRTQGTWINVVDQVVLGQNRGIILCEIGEKLYALGVTDHNINLLFEVNNQKLLEEVSQMDYQIQLANNANNIYQQIKSIIDGLANRRRKDKAATSNFSSLMGEQIRKMQELSKQYAQNDVEDVYRRSDNHE